MYLWHRRLDSQHLFMLCYILIPPATTSNGPPSSSSSSPPSINTPQSSPLHKATRQPPKNEKPNSTQTPPSVSSFTHKKERERELKMNALDSPLEALAFNYRNFAFSTWPWLAVLTAAISVWKIRAAAGYTAPANSKHPVDSRMNDPRSTASMTATAVNLVLESDGCANGGTGRRLRRRGKFTVYYESEGEERGLTEDGGAEEERRWGGDWKRGLRMRVGEDASLGWYRYQDLAVLDGNVVKLWDGDVRPCGGREFNKLVTAVW